MNKPYRRVSNSNVLAAELTGRDTALDVVFIKPTQQQRGIAHVTWASAVHPKLGDRLLLAYSLTSRLKYRTVVVPRVVTCQRDSRGNPAVLDSPGTVAALAFDLSGRPLGLATPVNAALGPDRGLVDVDTVLWSGDEIQKALDRVLKNKDAKR
jgi:hypothetical protein